MRVIIAEDSVLLREGLAALLTDAGDTVVAAVGDADALLRAVAADPPDLCIVDVRMPPGFSEEGLRAALVIRARWPEVPILVLSQYVEERYATDLLGADPRGIGYLLKHRVSHVADFLDAARRVADGGSAFDPDVVSQLLARTRHQDPLARLTGRESEVLAAMAQGLSNAGIARELVIGDAAAEKHISSIFTKLDLHPGDGQNRRVLAVLRYLQNTP